MTTPNSPANLHQGQPVMQHGPNLGDAPAAMILVHGRGASAASILGLAGELPHPQITYLAPQAANQTWYPHSFMMPIAQNQPWLDSALAALGDMLQAVLGAGIAAEHVILGGFSQGACLASEFVARHPRRYGGLLVFSGGLIGPEGTPRDYPGDLDGTPVLVGCSDVDFHIPLARVHETSQTLQRMGAAVTQRIYPGMGHTINADEIAHARQIVAAVGAAAARHD